MSDIMSPPVQCSFVTRHGDRCAFLSTPALTIESHVQECHTTEHFIYFGGNRQVECFYSTISRRYFLCPVEGCFVQVHAIPTLEEHCHAKHISKEEEKQNKLLRRKAQPICCVCSETFITKYSYEDHISSSTHIYRERYIAGSGCDICCITFGQTPHSLENEINHYKGKKHARKEEKRKKFLAFFAKKKPKSAANVFTYE